MGSRNVFLLEEEGGNLLLLEKDEDLLLENDLKKIFFWGKKKICWKRKVFSQGGTPRCPKDPWESIGTFGNPTQK